MAKVIPITNGKFRLPDVRDRITIVGSTGSGKTVGALWHLSHASFDVRPYVIVDHKIDENISQIDCPHIGVGEVPTHPGLYVCNPLASEKDAVDNYLMSIWERENIGLYLDEGYMFDPDGPGLIACYTQGRSKRIPIITLSQRPVSISRFAFSEPQFIQCYRLIDARDRKTVRNFAPIPPLYKGEKLPEYWSFYYDVGRDQLNALRPVPNAASSLARIEQRLQALERDKPRRRYI